MLPALAAVNTGVYGEALCPCRPSLINMADQLSGDRLARPGPEDTGEKRLHRAEGGSAGEDARGLARQFLLAFRRRRRVPCRRPRALARDCHRAGHRQSRSAAPWRRFAAAAAPRVQLKPEAGAPRCAAGPPTIGGARKAVQGDRSAAAVLYRADAAASRRPHRHGTRLPQVLYWAFLGFVVSDKPLPRKQRDEVIDELIRIASSQHLMRAVPVPRRPAPVLKTRQTTRLLLFWSTCMTTGRPDAVVSQAAGNPGVPPTKDRLNSTPSARS